jgi:hypothetical protein
MDHAEAHERLGDLVLEPALLAALERDSSPEMAELRAHLATCDECRAELASLRLTDQAIRDAFADPAAAGPPAILRAPAELRDRVLAAAATGGSPEIVQVAAAPPHATRRWLSLALAAALVLAVGFGGVLAQRLADLKASQDELAEMTEVVAMLDRILAAEKHVTVPLTTADGSPGGAIAWSRTEVVVLSTSIDRPPAGREYACWVEENGQRWKVGEMHFSGSTAYWAGPLDDWNASFDAGTRFGVSLSPPAGGDPLPVLVAEF